MLTSGLRESVRFVDLKGDWVGFYSPAVEAWLYSLLQQITDPERSRTWESGAIRNLDDS
jgi:hypothetical protein